MHWTRNSRRNNTLYFDVCYSEEIKLLFTLKCAFRMPLNTLTYSSWLIIKSMRSSSSILRNCRSSQLLCTQVPLQIYWWNRLHILTILLLNIGQEQDNCGHSLLCKYRDRTWRDYTRKGPASCSGGGERDQLPALFNKATPPRSGKWAPTPAPGTACGLWLPLGPVGARRER